MKNIKKKNGILHFRILPSVKMKIHIHSAGSSMKNIVPTIRKDVKRKQKKDMLYSCKYITTIYVRNEFDIYTLQKKINHIFWPIFVVVCLFYVYYDFSLKNNNNKIQKQNFTKLYKKIKSEDATQTADDVFRNQNTCQK